MAEQQSGEGASTSDGSVAATDSTVEINIKTLDSQMYNFRVEKNMPVSSFKGKIADQIGVPVGQQRLIFRGKVLKDEQLLSEYHVENGDTLHLVERQLTQPQTSSGADTSGTNGGQGIDGGAGAPRNRIGQISHSVVLGTLNVGDQGEGGVSDINRVIGAVLSSLGVGNQTASAAFGAPNIAPANSAGTVPQGNNAEQGPGGNGSQSQAGNQAPFGQPFLSQPFQAPLAGISIPSPSLNMPIPDSLNTLSEFMSRMEGVLSHNGYQASSSPSSTTDQPATELPLNARGPEALGIVLRHAQRLLSGPAVAALSHIAGRMEQDASSTDASVRSQVQSESVQVGLAMQHLGALLLELGRTTLMLRMGQSPAEAVVNAGHAVYISSSGPNPIMVQPFPHQTSPLFNTPAVSAPNTGTSVPVGVIGSAPRHINIHIHAGTSLSPMGSAVGSRAAGGEGAQGQSSGVAASSDTGVTRVFPGRNVIATAVPSRSATIAVSPAPNTSQPVGVVSTSQPPDAASLSSVISQVNTRIRSFLENMNTDNQTTSGQQESSAVPSSFGGSGEANADATDQSKSSSGEANSSQSSMPGQQAQEEATEMKANTESNSIKPTEESGSLVGSASGCGMGEFAYKSTGAREAPLGLGGGLQPKRRNRQSQVQSASGEGGPSSSPDQSQQARISGQEILQSLASRSTAGRSSIDSGSGQTEQGFGQSMAGMQASAQGTDGQLDVTGTMSQLLQSPALNGLLSGVAQQTGFGSPDVLRNMLQQFTQNPAMRNTVNQLAQQVDREEFRDMFTSMGTGEDGSLDFSSMVQQMMPVVSQVLGGGSVQNEQLQSMMPQLLPQIDGRSLEDNSYGQVSQELAQRIAHHSPPQDIFQAVVQNAAVSTEAAVGELTDVLCNNQDLVNEFVEMLRHDLRLRLQDNSASGGNA